MNAEFKFDAALHQYTLGGRVIPSVTGILKDGGILKFGGAGTELENQNAMARGKAIHAACEYLDQNALAWFTVQDDILPYVMAYEKFKKETSFKPTRIEEKLYHPTMGFAGTLDREGTWDLSKGHILIDIKTGDVSPATALQLAGYDALLPTLALPRRRYALQLKSDVTYKLVEFKDPQDKNLFLSLVAIHWWKQNNT